MQRSHQKLHIVFWKPECWSFIFAHSQHMAVTIHWLFRNMHGHSFMLLYIHVSDATAYNTLNTLKIVASHGRWQKLVSADSPILSLYLYKRSGAKSHLAMGLDTLLWLTQLELGWDLMDLPTSAKLWFCDRLSPQTGGDYTTSLSVFDHPQWKEMCFLMFRYIVYRKVFCSLSFTPPCSGIYTQWDPSDSDSSVPPSEQPQLPHLLLKCSGLLSAYPCKIKQHPIHLPCQLPLLPPYVDVWAHTEGLASVPSCHSPTSSSPAAFLYIRLFSFPAGISFPY